MKVLSPSGKVPLSEKSKANSRSPIEINLRVPVVASTVSDSDLKSATAKIWPKQGDSLSLLIHSLHALHGYDGERIGISLEEAERVLLDNQLSKNWFDGNLTLQRSRYGVRYVMPLTPGRFSQAHVDQILVLLAEYQVSLDHRFKVPDGWATVADLLNDCRAELRLRGEFEWSILAMALYAADQKTWKNRFDEQLSFDQAAAALMLKPLEAGSCGGAHILYSLAAMSQISETQELLRSDVLGVVNRYLYLVRDAAVFAQRADGAVDPAWMNSLQQNEEYIKLREFALTLAQDHWSIPFRPAASRNSPPVGVPDWVNVTSHQCEWMMVLPSKVQPDPAFFGRCATFLQNAIRNETEASVREFFCPYSHATLILRRLAERAVQILPQAKIETTSNHDRGCTAALQSVALLNAAK
ncbi:MAG: hypothetical protein WCJ09_08495 [Planctomycetota bacterium]